MNKFTGCLLVSDVDGTLAMDRFIHPDNVEAIARFRDEGGMTVLATGRTPQSAVTLEREVCHGRYLVANNGSLLYDCDTDSVVWEATCDFTPVMEAVRRDFPDMGILSYWRDKLYRFATSPIVEWLLDVEDLTLDDTPLPVANKLLFGADPARLDELMAYLDANKACLPYTFVRPSPRFLEVLPQGVDKATAVRHLMQCTGIDQSHLFAAGNYYNDIPMLDLAGHACVPTESPDAVKAHATYVSRPCKDGAVADFLAYLETVYPSASRMKKR